MIPASQWNELLARRRKNRIVSINERRGPKWRHHWFTTAAWNADKERWEATVKPGFVWNGRTCDVTAAVTGEDGLVVDVPLTDSPAIALTSFRHIGTDATSIDGSGEAVPGYFAARGVADPMTFTTDGEDGLTQVVSGLESPDKPQRLLRACDLVLYHDRPATTVDWTITPPEIGQQAQFNVGVKTAPSARNGAYLRVLKEFVTPSSVDVMTKLQGAYDADTRDALKVCTVYLLSPPDTAFDSPPDETWEPHVKHEQFWNLIYAHTAPAINAPAQQLAINLAGLGNAAGAQFTVNQILSQSNDAFNNALQFLTAREIVGRFWSI